MLSPEQEKVERRVETDARQPKAGCHIYVRLRGLEAVSRRDGSPSNEEGFISPDDRTVLKVHSFNKTASIYLS